MYKMAHMSIYIYYKIFMLTNIDINVLTVILGRQPVIWSSMDIYQHTHQIRINMY